ncbi:DUF4188 domain-containing protein (plasmid) [Salinigranum rubrum]|uniref:DUF4188 domain-containing protein n=2 Tax=Salinigranum rubrum TaxID=755307 RepID=A0A2I8VRI1_9EURY|nr:DUF4188 domain-containing protein [Salinigranum rubrum]
MAAEIDGDFVIYINGFRLNKLRAVHKWIRAGRKIGVMFEELAADPDSGFLGYQPALQGLRGGGSIQYWRSLEDLQRFAQDPNDMHVPAWKWVNENLQNGEVGFWAEIYLIENGNYETFYRDMPPKGLGSLTELVPMAEHTRRFGMTTGRSIPGDGHRSEDADDNE